MRLVILSAAVVAILAGAACAELPSRGYIGLYADAARLYTSYCSYPGYSIAKIEMWIWCLPGENGLQGAEFAVGYPSNVMLNGVTYSSHLAAMAGDLLSGISVNFDACQWDYCWVAHQTLYVNSPLETYVEIVPHPGVGVFQFFTCGEGNPAEPCLKGTSLYLNAPAMPCLPPETAIGTGESTWGAVKGLFTGRGGSAAY